MCARRAAALDDQSSAGTARASASIAESARWRCDRSPHSSVANFVDRYNVLKSDHANIPGRTSKSDKGVLAARGESRPGSHALRIAPPQAIAQVDCSGAETSRVKQ